MPLADRAAQRPTATALALPERADELEHALSQGLRTPVAALRASVEGLSSELRDARPRPAAIPGALEEVELLGRNVERLLEWVGPAAPAPLRCRLEEVLRTAARPWRRPSRPRLLVLCPASDAWLFVDGALLARALQRLIENGLEGGSEDVLLGSSLHPGHVAFSVVSQAASPFDPEWALAPFHTTKPNRLGLGLPIAARHAALLGGSLELVASATGLVRATLELPLRPAEGDAAADLDRELAA